MIGGLLLIQGEDEPAPVPLAPAALESPASSANPPPFNDGSKGAKAKANSELVSASSSSSRCPRAGERIDPAGGATFAAVAADGSADATLWVSEDPKLDFPTFVSLSLRQLEALAGSAQIVERVPAPTAEATIVRLAADAPAGPALLRGHPARRRRLPLLPRDQRPADALARGRRGRRADRRIVHPGGEGVSDVPHAARSCWPTLALAAPLPAFALSGEAD